MSLKKHSIALASALAIAATPASAVFLTPSAQAASSGCGVTVIGSNGHVYTKIVPCKKHKHHHSGTGTGTTVID